MIRRVFPIILALILALLFALPVSAHPGATDAAGGHIDHSTGSYHYHHGYPAHSHRGNVCPYDFDDRTGWNSGSSSSGSSLTTQYQAALNKSKKKSSASASTDTEQTVSEEQHEATPNKTQKGESSAANLQKGIMWRNIALIALGFTVVWLSFSLSAANKDKERLQSMCLSLKNDKTDLNQELNQAITSLSACTKKQNGLQARCDELAQTYERTAEQLAIARKQLDNFRILAVNDEPSSATLLDQLREAEKKAEQCEDFIRSFGPDAEIFFAQPDASARLSRMMADYLTLVYDASADYLDQKERPAHVEAKRIRELKAETKEWIDRALRAEYELERFRPDK